MDLILTYDFMYVISCSLALYWHQSAKSEKLTTERACLPSARSMCPTKVSFSLSTLGLCPPVYHACPILLQCYRCGVCG